MGQQRDGNAARTASILHRLSQAGRVVRWLGCGLPAALHKPEWSCGGMFFRVAGYLMEVIASPAIFEAAVSVFFFVPWDLVQSTFFSAVQVRGGRYFDLPGIYRPDNGTMPESSCPLPATQSKVAQRRRAGRDLFTSDGLGLLLRSDDAVRKDPQYCSGLPGSSPTCSRLLRGKKDRFGLLNA
jgi:hypothetical protein